MRQAGTISNDLHALEKLINRIRSGRACTIRACYEAGPCGFVIARRSKQLGIECVVVAPSLIPRQAGERIKTDRRDAEKLARLLRAGELSALYVPNPTDEAIRDLCRARTDAVATVGGPATGSKPFCCGTRFATRAKVPGRLPTCVICVNSCCPTRP